MLLYTGRQTFDPAHGAEWKSYVHWLGRPDLERVITLDPMLCPAVVGIESDSDWNFVVQLDYMLEFFTSLEFVRARVASVPRAMLLAVTREPGTEDLERGAPPGFEFAGFDLVDRGGAASALLNCGGFPEVFSATELSTRSGLLPSLECAYEVREALQRMNPDDHHADCYVWAIWYHTAIVRGSDDMSRDLLLAGDIDDLVAEVPLQVEHMTARIQAT